MRINFFTMFLSALVLFPAAVTIIFITFITDASYCSIVLLSDYHSVTSPFCDAHDQSPAKDFENQVSLDVQTNPDTLRNPLRETNTENSLWIKERQKIVYSRTTISSCEDLKNWSVSGIGEVSLTTEHPFEGGKSIRFKTLLRDEELIDENPGGRMMGSTQLIFSFEKPQDWSDFNRIALRVYVHSSDFRVHTFYLRLNILNEPESITDPRYATVIQNLTDGQWNQVFWEFPNLLRDSVISFSVQKLLTGHSANEDGAVCYDFDNIELQHVDPEKYEGWETANNKIAFSHVGYTPWQNKTAVGSSLNGTHFKIINAVSGEVVLLKEIKKVNALNYAFQILDFTEVTKPGKYVIATDEVTTDNFIIDENIWDSSFEKSLNFYFCERCGFDVPGIHPECHNDLFGVHNGITKQVNGGWHDAGDLSQGSFRTNMSVYAMLDYLNLMNARGTNPPHKNQLIDEVLWGIEWMLKTRFGNGYRITWSGVNIYTDGIEGNNDDYHKIAQNIPWENFIASGTEAYAFIVFKNLKPQIAENCLQAAIEDWNASIELEADWLRNDKVHVSVNEIIEKDDIVSHRWFSGGQYLTLSWAIISSLNLYSATGDEVYADYAIKYGSLLVKCQEQEFKDNIPLTGFFYTDTEKSSVVNHRHPGFEESPLIALSKLCSAFVDHEDWMKWYSAVTLHSEYFLKRGSQYTYPYNMIPASIYRKSDLMKVKGSILQAEMLKQFYEGCKLSEEYYLRNFPIWTTRSHHGATAIQLSQTLALTTAARLRNNLELENLVMKQMQWVLGCNPFSQSLMYGEGYDFQTLYSYNPGDIVGSLPVGFDCVKNDEPFWSMSNHSTFKEVWIVPVSRFLWNTAFLKTGAFVYGKVTECENKKVLFRNILTGKVNITELNSEGLFKINLPAGSYEINIDDLSRKIILLPGKSYDLSLSTKHYINFDIKQEEIHIGSDRLTLEIIVRGKGRHEVAIRTFNCSVAEPEKIIDLKDNEKMLIELDVQITEIQKPWVMVIIPGGELNWKKEILGDLLNL